MQPAGPWVVCKRKELTMRRVAILCSIVIVLGGAGQVSADYPSEWDWRDHDGVSSVKNQGSCGSDWALATVEALESKIMIETGVELDLSEQYVLNCAGGGCDGGSPAEALNFLRDEGTVAESLSPYVAADQPCPMVGGTRYTIDTWFYVGDDPWLVKQALYDNGPLVIITKIYNDFYSYSSGVYNHATGSYLGGHAMLLVGYSDSGQYWIVKNTWGPWWGENGFIRIAYADIDTFDLHYSYALGPLATNDDCDDSDGDGFGVNGDPSCPGGEEPDCDDEDPATYPGADELCDGLDNDCDGTVPDDELDRDGDGFAECAGDCDDEDPDTYPGADELCDGLDNSCDGVVPEDEADADGDGYRPCEGDCDDGDPATYPGADELCDGLDNDCDGVVPADEADADGDGSRICAGDCDDAAPSVRPGAAEVYDGVDNNCDGAVDEGLDDDGDGVPDFNDLCGDTPAGVGVGPDGCTVCVVIIDTDGDGIVDEADLCPASDLSSAVVIDGCDTGVANHLSADGCTILDGIAACAAAAGNHGQLASCVSHLTNELKRDGVISGKDKGAIQACLR
jgi:hypothetical protein